MKTRNILLALTLATSFNAMAKVTLPHIFEDNMVLQQQTNVKLWGKARPGAKVKVTTSWNNKHYTTTAASDSTFEVTAATPAASNTPYYISFNDGDELTLHNVLIGEVWFCSGQSNMEMPMRGFDRQPLLHSANDDIARAKASTPIRMFISDSDNGRWVRQWSRKPKDDCWGHWFENTPDHVRYCSAVAYYYAKYLHDVLDVPVGVIVSTLGGSKIQAWMSEPTIKQFPEIDTSILTNDKKPDIWREPCLLWNAKVAPFGKFPVKGVLWYQGESNRNDKSDYTSLMQAFVKDLRTLWGANLPFYFVEIAPFNYEGANGYSGALLREAQQRAMKTIPNCGMASSLDLGWPRFIHTLDKATLGERLAWMALHKTYGRTGFGYQSPVYKSMEIKDHKIYINMDNIGNGPCPMWTSLKGFEIAGKDSVFHPAFAEVEEKTCRLAVSSPDVPEPVAVRYAFHNYPEYSVYNIEGLPLLPFRTDNWPVK